MKILAHQFIKATKQAHPKLEPKHDHRVLICGYTHEEDCLFVETETWCSEYQENDIQDDRLMDIEEEGSQNLQTQGASFVHEKEDHDNLMEKLEYSSPPIHQFWDQSIHDKVNSLPENNFSSVSLANNTMMGALAAYEKKFHVVYKVFDKIPERMGYITALNPNPPDIFGLLIQSQLVFYHSVLPFDSLSVISFSLFLPSKFFELKPRTPCLNLEKHNELELFKVSVGSQNAVNDVQFSDHNSSPVFLFPNQGASVVEMLVDVDGGTRFTTFKVLKHVECKKNHGYIEETCLSFKTWEQIRKVANIHHTIAQDSTHLKVKSLNILLFDNYKFINVAILCVGNFTYSILKYFEMVEVCKHQNRDGLVRYNYIAVKLIMAFGINFYVTYCKTEAESKTLRFLSTQQALANIGVLIVNVKWSLTVPIPYVLFIRCIEASAIDTKQSGDIKEILTLYLKAKTIHMVTQTIGETWFMPGSKYLMEVAEYLQTFIYKMMPSLGYMEIKFEMNYLNRVHNMVSLFLGYLEKNRKNKEDCIENGEVAIVEFAAHETQYDFRPFLFNSNGNLAFSLILIGNIFLLPKLPSKVIGGHCWLEFLFLFQMEPNIGALIGVPQENNLHIMKQVIVDINAKLHGYLLSNSKQYTFGVRLRLLIVLPQLIVQVGCGIVYMVSGGKVLQEFMEITCSNYTKLLQTYWICIFGSIHFVSVAKLVGDTKMLSKIGVNDSLLLKVDIFVWDGEMLNSFYKVQGLLFGLSLEEGYRPELASLILEKTMKYACIIKADKRNFWRTHQRAAFKRIRLSLGVYKMSEDLLKYVNIDWFLVGGAFLKLEFSDIGDSVVRYLYKVAKREEMNGSVSAILYGAALG